MLMFLVFTCSGRIWTDHKGRTIEADVIKVNTERTVMLKLHNNKIKTVPFNTFILSDIEYLDYLLSRQYRGKLHSVSWEKMNENFGLQIWCDDWLWDDYTLETSYRLNVNFESKTDFMENYRSYPAGKLKILGEKIYAISLYGDEQFTDSLSFVFLNKGDAPRINSDAIDSCANRLLTQIESILGKPRRDLIGKGDIREKVWRWDWNDQSLLLSLKKDQYVILRIMPCERADRNGRIERLSYDDLRERIRDCVKTRDNGDVIINNIPMIDQGPKGYCAPATWERYLRYFDIPIDMYLIAVAVNTTSAGTYDRTMLKAMDPFLSAYGREIINIGNNINLKKVIKYIDLGLPIMWTHYTTPNFQLSASKNTAQRTGKKLSKAPQTFGGHICMIIGYNPKTNEVCISDSWGTSFQERWVSLQSIQQLRTDNMYVLKW